jgi:hypothetical protein
MIMEECVKRKRASFIPIDIDLLISEAQKYTNVLNSKKISGVTPAMKLDVSINLSKPIQL